LQNSTVDVRNEFAKVTSAEAKTSFFTSSNFKDYTNFRGDLAAYKLSMNREIDEGDFTSSMA
jgi:hypothetical protein